MSSSSPSWRVYRCWLQTVPAWGDRQERRRVLPWPSEPRIGRVQQRTRTASFIQSPSVYTYFLLSRRDLAEMNVPEHIQSTYTLLPSQFSGRVASGGGLAQLQEEPVTVSLGPWPSDLDGDGTCIAASCFCNVTACIGSQNRTLSVLLLVTYVVVVILGNIGYLECSQRSHLDMGRFRGSTGSSL